MNESFHLRRRQVFLLESYYIGLRSALNTWNEQVEASLLIPDIGVQNASLESAQLADNKFHELLLRYTAGEPIERLRGELASVVEAYERYQQALAVYEQVPDVAPLGLGDIGDYERCMQLVGLCYLLHRRDLLPRIAALQDPGYAAGDALYEELLDYALTDRFDTDLMLHINLYDPLVHAMYADTEQERTEDLDRYVKSWYPHFKYVPWHDGHKRMTETDGDYFGYWAFEAGAVALLCDIDDSRIGHMVYPKDLVAWARAHAALSGDASQPDAVLRCEAGAPCLRGGFWRTPATEAGRRRFDAGETMPAISSDYGRTIWQWDARQ